jgi:HAE1 family hydrophobic/amphiphilic exporter-1
MTCRRLITLLVCLGAGSASAAAQERLSLADVTSRALTRNHTIRIEREAIVAAESRIVEAEGEYDPQLRIQSGTSWRRTPVTTVFTGAPDGDLAPHRSSLWSTASVSQLFKTGAVATFTSSLSRDSTNDAFTLYDPANLTSLGVELRQPMLRDRAIDSARAALHITALDRSRSSAALARVVLDTVSDVERAYWTLVAARRELEVRRGNVALAEQQAADTQVRIEARTVPASDLAQPVAEVERRRGDLFAAQEAVARAERALKSLVLGDRQDPLWAVEIVPTDVPELTPVAIDLAAALARAATLRPEFAESAAALAQHGVQVKLAEDRLKPRLDLIAGYTAHGLAGGANSTSMPFGGLPVDRPESLDGGLNTATNTMWRQRFPDARVGVSVEIPIGKRETRGQLGVAASARRRAELSVAQLEEQIAVEVRNAATALETAAGRVQAARAGLAAAETQLRAEQDRFSVGASTNFFVLTRQNDLALAQLAEIAALADYRKALTDVGRATGSLLADRSIHINGFDGR